MAERRGITVNVVNCARCHLPNHVGLVFEALATPVMVEGKLIATHWAPCPRNGEPILLIVKQP